MNGPITLVGSPPHRIPGNEVINPNLEIKGQLGLRRNRRGRPSRGGEVREERAVPVCVLTGRLRRLGVKQQLCAIQGGCPCPLRHQRGEGCVHGGLPRPERPFSPILGRRGCLCFGLQPVPGHQGGMHGDPMREWMSPKQVSVIESPVRPGRRLA
eukprot:1173836-Rhodomonas_salina.1